VKSVITAEHVTKRFGGFEAVSDVSFEAPDSQQPALLGPNGAGKTTTLEMLEGFSAPSSGALRVLGAVPTTHYLVEADHLAQRILVLAGGQIAADTTPARLQAQGGPATIRHPLEAPDTDRFLPAQLARHLNPDGRTLLIRTTDIPAVLRDLADFAVTHHLSLAGLEVGPLSLEEASLTVIDSQTSPEGPVHD
jgi:ABC-type multidrug transport system ATPase subunit